MSDQQDSAPRSSSKKQSKPSAVKYIMPTQQDADRYNMSHSKRGMCIVFNNEKFEGKRQKDRDGSTVDVKRIRKTFGKLGFKVTVHTDWKRDQIEKEIRKLSRSDHSDNDCICVFVLTHGGASGGLEAFDKNYNSKMIWEPFTADKCPKLAGKPKLFFFQACRGEKTDEAVKLDRVIANRHKMVGEITEQSRVEPESGGKIIPHKFQALKRRKIDGCVQLDVANPDKNFNGTTIVEPEYSSYKIPTYADFLLAHSSVEEYRTFRNTLYGTWYIQTLCDVLDEYANEQALSKMMTTTARKVATNFEHVDSEDVWMTLMKQVSSCVSTLTRELYFTPNDTKMTGPTTQRQAQLQAVEKQRVSEEPSTKNTDGFPKYEEVPDHSILQKRKPRKFDVVVSTDRGCEGRPGDDARNRTDITPSWPSDEDEEEQIDEGTPTEIVAKMPVSQESEEYNMSHPKRGKCLILNHEEFKANHKLPNRMGTSNDVKQIKDTFTKLGFDVVVCDNFEYSKVLDEINKLSSEDHTDYDCVCIFLLTHGTDDDFVHAWDVAYSADEIWKPFTADVCPTLAGKPKLFFYQTCRGKKLDDGVMLTSRNDNSTQMDGVATSYTIPTHADILIGHSSVNEFSSLRHSETGSWYIQCLCSVLNDFAETTDLMMMLTITARKVATEYQSSDGTNPQKKERKQVPSTTSMLIRQLYFKPK